MDKQVGLCYLIPMSFADGLADDESARVSLVAVEKYKENWGVVKILAGAKNEK